MSTLKEKAEAILQEKTEKIVPENFSSELEIFGVVGNIPTINNINKVVSSILDLEENNQTRFMSDMENNTNIMCEPNTSIFLDCSNPDLANVIGLTANKIKKDETILGITGTYEGSSSQTTLPSYYILKKIPFLYINSSGQIKNGDSYVFMVAYNSLKYRCPIIGNTGHNEYLKATVEDSSAYAGGDVTIPIRNQLDYYDKILSVTITTNTIPSASYESAYQITTTRNAQTSFDDNIYLEEVSTGNIVYFQDVTLWVQNDYNQ